MRGDSRLLVIYAVHSEGKNAGHKRQVLKHTQGKIGRRNGPQSRAYQARTCTPRRELLAAGRIQLGITHAEAKREPKTFLILILFKSESMDDAEFNLPFSPKRQSKALDGITPTRHQKHGQPKSLEGSGAWKTSKIDSLCA